MLNSSESNDLINHLYRDFINFHVRHIYFISTAVILVVTKVILNTRTKSEYVKSKKETWIHKTGHFHARQQTPESVMIIHFDKRSVR